MTRRLFVLFVAIALALAACGGDDDDTASDDAEGTTTSEQGDDSDAGGDEGEDEGDSGDEELGDEFTEALERAEDAVIKVTYEVTGEGQDPTEFTIAQDPPRFAFMSETGLLIDDGERFITCGPDGVCVSLPREGGEGMAQSMLGAFAGPFLAFQQGAESGLSGFDVTGDEEIAGRDATCASIDAAEIPGGEGSGTVTTCVDKETGILLLYDGERTEDGGRIEATDVSDPSEEDFEPTSEPQDFGN